MQVPRRILKKSTAAVPKGAKSAWKRVASESLAIQSAVASGHKLKEADKRLTALEREAECCTGNEGRWRHNCALAAVRLYLAQGNVLAAQSAWKRSGELWAGMNCLTGWQRGSRATIGYARGCLAAAELKADLTPERNRETALGPLARGIVLLVGRHWNFPQECRDLMFASADLLKALDKSRHAEKLRIVAERVREGCSWIRPYREEKEKGLDIGN